MRQTFGFLLALGLLCAAALPLQACSNTMHGAGQDIEEAGETVQDATQ